MCDERAFAHTYKERDRQTFVGASRVCDALGAKQGKEAAAKNRDADIQSCCGRAIWQKYTADSLRI